MFCRANQFEMNSNFVGDNNVVQNEMNVDIDMTSNNNNSTQMSSSPCSPIKEAMQERCVHRTIYHEVPQAFPFLIEK